MVTSMLATFLAILVNNIHYQFTLSSPPTLIHQHHCHPVHFTFEIFLKNVCFSDFHGLPIFQKSISTNPNLDFISYIKIGLKWCFFLFNMKLTIQFVHFVVQFFVLEHFLEVPSCYLFNWSLFHSQIRLPVFFLFSGQVFSSQTSSNFRSIIAHFIGLL